MTAVGSGRPGLREPPAGAAPGADADGAVFELREVRARYPGADRDVLRSVSLEIAPGGHTAVLGPNGAGKSTLLRVMLGLLTPSAGEVRFGGRPVSGWKRRALARRVAVVTQERPPDFPLSVEEFVEMGRNPYLRPWEAARPVDRAAVERALDRVELGPLEGRGISTLSDGELQRAKVARALAQDPSVLLLDEPTAHLDMGHEVAVFDLLSDLVGKDRITAVSVTHNLHLASRYADQVLLLAGGRVTARGPARRVLRPEPLERAFGWPVRVVDLGDEGLQIVPLSSR